MSMDKNKELYNYERAGVGKKRQQLLMPSPDSTV